MNVNEYMATTIYNLCNNSNNATSREEWDNLSNEMNEYIRQHNLDEEEIDCFKVFSVKPDEYELLVQIIDDAFETYPLIQTFFDEHRDMNFPPLNMISIIRSWAQEFIENNEQVENVEEESFYLSDEENEDEDEENNSEASDYDPMDEYVTVKYFQGLFAGVYELFMSREI